MSVSPPSRRTRSSRIPRDPAPSQRGFAIVMMLMVILLMLFLVLAYLRTMRIYNTQHVRATPGNIQAVADGLASDLANMIGQDGKIGPLNSGENGLVYEPYDYPWTCTRRNNPCTVRYPATVTSTQGLGDPRVDDTWLMPIEPENGVWAQVSNPVGSFLQYTQYSLSNIPVHPSTRSFVPGDAPAGQPVPDLSGGQKVDFQNLSVSDPRLVDTDGDGVGDSLWFYPRLNTQGSVRYVAAVRIVDLSGMLNLNTAFGESALATAPGATTGTPRKGEGPYEIDASPLAGAMPTASKTFRQTGVPVPPDPNAVPSKRAVGAWTDWDYWQASGARTQDSGLSALGAVNRYDIQAEFAVRDLVRDNAAATSRLFDDYPGLKTDFPKRNMVTTLSGVRDVCAATPNTPFDNSSTSDYTFDKTRRPFDLYANQVNPAQPAPPSPFPALAGGSNTPFTYNGRWDNLHFYSGSSYGVADFLRGITHSAESAYPYPKGFSFLHSQENEATLADFYNRQMGMASFAGMLDRDNLTSIAWYWMGWEPLPVMTEFYAQMPYVVMCPNTTQYLPNSPATLVLFPKTQLADITETYVKNLAALFWISGVSWTRVDPYFFTNNGSNIEWQYQSYGASWTRAIKVRLTQVGQDVVATHVYTKLIVGDVRGSNFDTLAGTTTRTTPNQYERAYLGLPVTTGSTAPNWTNIYINNVINRTATGGAGTSTGELVYGGNNLTSTDWHASGSAGIGSYALELVNPYSIPIRLTNIRFNFRRYDYNLWDIFRNANSPYYASQDISTYVRALPPAGMAQDAEGYYVLKPGEKLVLYRNGTELDGPGGPRRKPFGGKPDISGLIASGAGVYTLDLGATIGLGTPAITKDQVPDINNYPSTWNAAAITLENTCQNFNGGSSYITHGSYNWVPMQRLLFQPLGSGYDGNNCYQAESNVPDGRQGAPGDLVYRQVDARIFGLSEGMNVLQARSALFPARTPYETSNNPNQLTNDWGDQELRTNTYAKVGKGVLTTGRGDGALPYPAGSQTVGGIWNYGHNNVIGTTMPLGSCNPADASQPAQSYLRYDTGNGGSGISALGQSAKVAFPGATVAYSSGSATLYPDPGGTVTIGGVNYADYGTTRQSLKNAPSPGWHYVGLPGDAANFPGTFPEFTVANNGKQGIRDNAFAGGGAGPERQEGLPRVLDLIRAPLIGPVFTCWYPGGLTGNNPYRGAQTTSWWNNGAVDSPLVGNWHQNNMGDALNFYLVKDTDKSGLRGLCLRTDVPWFDWTKAQNATTPKYANLLYDGAKAYVAGDEALSGGEVYVAQADGTLPAPNPDPAAGNVGSGKTWGYSNGPFARASQFWQASWAEVLCNNWQVDGPGYKGKTYNNGGNWKPGMINLNTAPQSVLKCLSLPKGVSADTVAAAIMANRKAPANGASVAGGVRKGLALASEALGPQGLKSYASDSALVDGTGTGKFYTNDTNINLGTLSWLPQQATCRSDAFCAYVVIQGFPLNDFNKGAIETLRQIHLFTRDATGAKAMILSYTVPKQ